MNEAASNICHWCGVNCTFMATAQGLCLPCGDRMQTLQPVELVRGLAKAVHTVHVSVAAMEAAIKWADEYPRHRDWAFIVQARAALKLARGDQ